MALKVGFLGTGSFASCFVPLFEAHPLVEEVVLCDRDPGVLRSQCERFGAARSAGSLEELLSTGVDAVAIFTPRWMHAPQALAALRAGKHVYSAVPAAVTVDEMGALVDEVRRSGLVYMTGETSYYYPCALYCRERLRKGEFGRFVYGEGEYYHDFDHGFYEVYQRLGPDWRRYAAFPPMLYPTHSVSMILSVTGARVESVSCLGYRDVHEDGLFEPGSNAWGNAWSNQTALARTSDGGMARFNEFRRVGVLSRVAMSLYGTEGSYEEQGHARFWETKRKGTRIDLAETLSCHGRRATEDERAAAGALLEDFVSGFSPVHPVSRLPREFRGKPNGHFGSHQFLVDDFVRAVAAGRHPPNHVWAAARYCLPGIVAHESAKRDGERLPVPDLGAPPPGKTLLDE